jgi:hypothetical protein
VKAALPNDRIEQALSACGPPSLGTNRKLRLRKQTARVHDSRTGASNVKPL